MIQGRSQDFSKGGHTGSYRGYSPDCHLNIVGCLLTKRLTKGGVTGTPGPPPGYALAMITMPTMLSFLLGKTGHKKTQVCLRVQENSALGQVKMDVWWSKGN